MLRGEKQQRGPRRVVIVSDDPLFVETTSIGFRTAGDFTVFHCPATARTQAQAIVRAGRDLVLLDDAGSPDGALDLVRELRSQVERPVLLVLSSSSDVCARERILDQGATAVVSKSIAGNALVSFARETLAGRISLRVGRGAGAELSVAA